MQNSIQDILTNLALGVLTLLCAYAMLYIKKAKAKVIAEAQQIDDDNQRNLVLAAINRLDDVATKTVKSIEQTAAKAIREGVKSGTTSRDDLLVLGRQAYDEVIKTLEPEYLAVLTTTLGDVDAYIQHTIESKVLELKEAA
ncbi:guanylate kinase [Paenibacillus sp. M1]|uniref:Guanylate kinase n=1 Tax=Paenibacillus haidiansis TaxID=1574488 RepID=A0ABU7VS01_9BACL